jgi:large subunit ribosomal protein L21
LKILAQKLYRPFYQSLLMKKKILPKIFDRVLATQLIILTFAPRFKGFYSLKTSCKMYAIVEIAGQQFKITKDQKIFVHRLDAEEGAELEFDRVLLTADGNNIEVGAPVVNGALIKAKVLAHVKADKVMVFKKKRRKGYQKMNGHRQLLTQIQIEELVG